MQAPRSIRTFLLSLVFCVIAISAAHAAPTGPATGGPGIGAYKNPTEDAPPNAPYLVVDYSTALTDERKITAGTGLLSTDNGTNNTFVLYVDNQIVNGFTGATTQQGAANNILNFASKASGDMWYYNGTNVVRLAKGSNGDYLTLTTGLPAWTTVATGAPTSAEYVVSTANGSLPNADIITAGTGITVTNGTNLSTIAIDSTVSTLTGVQTETNKTLTSPKFTYSASNMLELKNSGGTFSGKIVGQDWAANRLLMIPEPGADASFVLTEGNQTVNGTKTFSDLKLSGTTFKTSANTITVPASTDTLVNLGSTQTLMAKTLTAPHFTSASTFILDQSTANYTFDWANPASARAIHIVDPGAAANVAMITGTQTQWGVLYDATTTSVGATGAGSTGQALVATTSNAPTWGVVGANGGGTGQSTYTKGDLLVTPGSTTINKLAVGSDNQVLISDSASTNGVKWANSTAGAGTGIAFVTIGADATLSAERALTAGTGISVTDGGANTTATIAVDSTVIVQTGSQTISGNKTFGNTNLLLNDTAANNTTTIKQNSDEASNRTLNIPALGANCTLGVIDISQSWAGTQTFTNAPVLSSATLTANSNLITIQNLGAANIVQSEGTQTINGTKTFGTALGISSGGTNNGSLSVTAGSVPYMDGSKVVALAPTAGQFIKWDNGGTTISGFLPAYEPGGRLTLTTGTPVTTADVTAAGTIYYTPYMHNVAWLKRTNWEPHTFSEVSLSLTLTNGSVYDIFLYSNAGTPTLEALVWTNTTTRATAIVQDATTKLPEKSGDATRLYVGTIYATATNQTEDSKARRMVYNEFNRVPRMLYTYDNANTWTMASATFRASDNKTAAPAAGTENKFDFVIGGFQAEAAVPCAFYQTCDGGGNTAEAGIAMNSTTVPAVIAYNTTLTSNYITVPAATTFNPALGYSYVTGLEACIAAFTLTVIGDNAATPPETHLEGTIWN